MFSIFFLVIIIHTREKERIMDEIREFILFFYKITRELISEQWEKCLDYFDFKLLLKVIVVSLIGFFLAKLLSKYIPIAIRAIGKRMNLNINYDFTIALRSFIFKLILFSFILIATNMFHFHESIDFISKSIIKSILILSFVSFLIKISKIILYKMANSPFENNKDNVKVIQLATLPLFENAIQIIFSLTGIYQVFSIWNVDMTALLAGAGIGAMAIGMAAKDTLSDMIAGILILIDRPYSVGDIVYVKNNLKGKVITIGLRNTRLLTKNNVEIIVPNSSMGTSKIINESSFKTDGLRIEMNVSTSTLEDIHIIKAILIEAAKLSKKVSQDRDIISMMTGFQMNMLHFKLQYWIDNSDDKGIVKGEIIENIYLKFKENNIDLTMTSYQKVNLSYEEPQEIYITQFPDTKQEHVVKEMPNLFGVGLPKTLTKITKNPLKDVIKKGNK